MNKTASLIRLGDETFFENPWETFLTEIICSSLGLSSSFLPPAFSSILAWQSPLCRNVVANTMKSLSTWLFSKVIRHVWPGKSAPPTCQVKSVDDYIFKCCLQLHTTRAQRQNSRGLGWTFAAIYWFGMEEQYMLLDSLKWWANSALGVGKKLFLLSKKIPVERNCYGQSQNHM